MSKSSQLGYWVAVGMLAGQGVLLLLGAPVWGILLPGAAVAVWCGIHEPAKFGKPSVAYAIAAILVAASLASFWFVPEDLSFRAQLARGGLLDLTLVWLGWVIAAEVRRTASN